MPAFVQWENENLNTAFPFADDGVSEDFPKDALVDACLTAPADVEMSLSCLHVGPELASVVISASGTPVLHANVVVSDYAPFSPKPLDTLVPGYSGFVTFGDLSKCKQGTYKSAEGIRFSAAAIVVYPVPGVTVLSSPEYATSVSGDIKFSLPDGISAMMEETDENESTIRFVTTEEFREQFKTPCFTPKDALEMPTPIRRINGLAPDKYGRIMLFFRGGAMRSRLGEDWS